MDDGDFFSTVRKVLSVIEGSYSLVIMDKAVPDTIICTKKDNPLIIGLGDGENFIASDIPAVINHTRKIYILDDCELAIVKKDGVSLFDAEGKPIKRRSRKSSGAQKLLKKAATRISC